MAINSDVESVRSDRVAPPSPDDVMAILRGVIDPELGSDIVDLGMARQVLSHPNGIVEITVALTTPGCPLRAQIQRDIKARVESLPGVEKVKIHWDTLNTEEKAVTMSRARQLAQKNAPDTMIPATTKVVGVASGKGGVGKSSVTANIAVAIASLGYRVGVMDADIWGFSIPRMLGISGRLEGVKDQVVEPGARPKIAPITLEMGEGSLEVVSMGLMVDDEEIALMWRGLMLNRAVQHFLEDVQWHSKLDYLFIDMPPGTGDVAMGLARMLPRVELLVVTTPSLTAQKVAIRAANMARRSHVRVAGVIENMSYFVCDHGEEYPLFGEGGGELLARDAGVPLLGRIPLEPAVAAGGDHGRPVALSEGPAAQAFNDLAQRLITETIPPIEMGGCSARLLDSVNSALDALDFD